MKKTILVAAITTLSLAGSAGGYGQTIWNYDFGTGSGTFDPSNTASTSFLPAPATNGGTARVRVSNAQGGSFHLENPGSSLGTHSELRLVAPTGSSVNKFSIYDYSTAATTFSIAFEMRLTGGSAGNFYFFMGDGANYSNDSAFSGAQVFTGIQFQYGSSSAITANYRNGASWTTFSGTPFAQDTHYSVEIYGNNAATQQTYTRSGTNTLEINTWDMWIGGTKAFSGLAKAQLANASNLDSFMFYGESSTGNVANLTVDSIIYASGLTAVPEPSTALLVGLGAVILFLRRKLAQKAELTKRPRFR